jgi:hypothetical protein
MSKQPSLRCWRELFNSDISREHAKHFGVANRLQRMRSNGQAFQLKIENAEWAVKGSNLRPSRCKRDALPLS